MATRRIDKPVRSRKNGRAMPRKPSKKKTKSLRLYFTEEEYADYERRAEKEFLAGNLSVWMLQRIRRSVKEDDDREQRK